MFNDNKVASELDLGPPSEELQKWAKENIGENPDTRLQIISDFRDIIYARGECAPHRSDDAFLLRFLRPRDFVIERAHRLFVNYYDFKENNPELFEEATLSDLERMGEYSIFTVPPYRDQAGRRLLLYTIGNWDPQQFSIEDILKATLICLELAILEEQMQILGGVCIIDLSNLTMQQAINLNPSVAKKIIQIMVTSFPLRLHAVHIVHQPWMFNTFYNIFKPFINDRMTERLFFHGDDMESLHQHVDPKHLPQRYGGLHPEYDYNDWMTGFRSNKIIMKEMNSLGYGKDDYNKILK